MMNRRFGKFGTCLCLASAVLFLGAAAALGQDAKPKAGAKAKMAKIDLNSATAEELEQLSGVGKATSKKIIDGRPYKSVEDLSKAGITAREIEKIKPLVTVHAPAAAAPAAAKENAAGRPHGPVDLNSAGLDELQTLPGIGPVLAEAIVQGRPYKSFAELDRVKGLGKAKIAELNGRVKFGSTEAPATEKTAPAGKSASAAYKPVATKRVNINTASKETLDALPGIGSARSQAIIDARPFKSIDDIKKVKGIKDFEFNAVKDLITVD